jgi:Na+/melibiose symporter-like transporter
MTRLGLSLRIIVLDFGCWIMVLYNIFETRFSDIQASIALVAVLIIIAAAMGAVPRFAEGSGARSPRVTPLMAYTALTVGFVFLSGTAVALFAFAAFGMGVVCAALGAAWVLVPFLPSNFRTK